MPVRTRVDELCEGSRSPNRSPIGPVLCVLAFAVHHRRSTDPYQLCQQQRGHFQAVLQLDL